MPVRVQNRSRLRFNTLLSVDGVEFWDVQDLPTIPVRNDDVYHVVSTAERLDQLASKYYGDPVLWWVIAAANDLEIVPSQVNVGQSLRIPSQFFVFQVLLKSVKTPTQA